MEPPITKLALCRSLDSQLLIIDVQERLVSVMPDPDRRTLLDNLGRLLEAAKLLEIPVTVTRQYPKGLGPVVDLLAERLPDELTPRDKTGFSCCRADGFEQEIDQRCRRQLVISGVETHICVLQTASDLMQRGYQVFVVADAVCSRLPQNSHNALARMRRAGIQITNTESVLFEWMGDASHEKFKAVSALIR